MKVQLQFDNQDTYTFEGAPQEALDLIKKHMSPADTPQIPAELARWTRLWRPTREFVLDLQPGNAWRQVSQIPGGSALYLMTQDYVSVGELLGCPRVPEREPEPYHRYYDNTGASIAGASVAYTTR